MNIKAKATTNGTFGGTRNTASPSNSVPLAPEVTSGQNAQAISNSSDTSLLSDYSDYVEQAHDYDVEYRDWSAQEAQKARDWSAEQTSTSYQRAVKDMIAAGLNPALAYKLGGADTGSAASASSGGSNTASGLLSTAISSAVSSAIAAENRQSNKEIAYLNGYFGQTVANTYVGGNIAAANISAASQKYVSNNQLRGTMYQADHALEGSKYASNSNIYTTVLNNQSKADLQMLQDMAEVYMRQVYPQSMWGAINKTVMNISGKLTTGENADLTIYEAYLQMCGEIDSKYGSYK